MISISFTSAKNKMFCCFVLSMEERFGQEENTDIGDDILGAYDNDVSWEEQQYNNDFVTFNNSKY